MSVPQSAKRISALPPMHADKIDEVQSTAANEWAIGVDSLCRSNDTTGDYITGDDKHDEGSLYIPMSRIAMRDKNGLIPANMLPSYVDDMMFGTLTTSPEGTPTKATFTEVMPQGGTQHVYVSPASERSGSELPPPQNVIFCDTTRNIQYRFTGETSTDENLNHFGFTEVPGSRALNAGYGIIITSERDADNTTIAAKKPDFVTYFNDSSEVTVPKDTQSYFQLGGEPAQGSTLTASVDTVHNKVEVSGLNLNSRYVMMLHFEATPTTLLPKIIDVSLYWSNQATHINQMDMSGPTGRKTNLYYSFLFMQNDSNPFTLSIKAEESIKLKTKRFTVMELL